MDGFPCGICDETHPSTEFDGAPVRMPRDLDVDELTERIWAYSSYLGRQVGFCPVMRDFKVRMPNGTILFTDKCEYNLSAYEKDTIEWLEMEYGRKEMKDGRG